MTDKAEELKAQGNAAAAALDYAKAIDLYSQAIELCPETAVYYSNRAASYINNGQFNEALSDADKAIELRPDWSRGYCRKGTALQRLMRANEALQVYSEGLEKCPGDKSITAAMEKLVQEFQGYQKQQDMAFQMMFGDGKIIKYASDPRLAKYSTDPTFQQMVAEVSGDAGAYRKYANQQFAKELLQVALESSMKDAGMPTSAPEPKKEEPKKEEPKKKEPEPEPEPEVSPERKEALELKQQANTLYKKRQFDEAIALYDKAAELDPTDMSFLTNKAAAYLEDAKYEECIKTCEEAIEVGRSNRAPFELIGKAYGRIAKAYHKMENFEEAIASYKKAQFEYKTRDNAKMIRQLESEKNKRDKEAYLNPELALKAKEEGNVLFKEKKFREAIEKYSEAIKRDPTNHVYYSNRAVAYTKVMNWPGVLEDCAQCVKINPNFTKIYVRQGNAYAMIGDYWKAVKAFRTGLAQDPKNEELTSSYARVMRTFQEQRASGQVNQAARERAMNDPEVTAVMREPEIQNALQELQRNPRAMEGIMKNPAISEKIEMLMLSQVI